MNRVLEVCKEGEGFGKRGGVLDKRAYKIIIMGALAPPGPLSEQTFPGKRRVEQKERKKSKC